MNFSDLGLIPAIQRAVAEAGYTQPTPIQERAIPPILKGSDLLGCAQTGTGKTAAFAVPILQRLSGQPVRDRVVRSLILTPTRELALQIYENFCDYGRYLKIRCCVIFGGVSQQQQVEQLRRGVDVLIATPGRLWDLHNQGEVRLGNCEILVLDEADRMLDMGFIHDVKRIIALLPNQKQTLLFSATMPDEITALVNSLLRQPVRVTVTPPSTTVEAIDQCLYFVDKGNKRKLLAHLLLQPEIQSALVFTRTKHGADRVARELARTGVQAAAIHGDKSQGARQKALSSFKDGSLRVLVATDIAARGIDIDELSHVFNYDLPNVPETYVHRIGRTGRAGLSGKAIAFCDFAEKPLLKDIERLIGKPVPVVEEHPYPMEVFEVPPKPEPQSRQPRAPRPSADPAGRNHAAGKQPRAPKPFPGQPVNQNAGRAGAVLSGGSKQPSPTPGKAAQVKQGGASRRPSSVPKQAASVGADAAKTAGKSRSRGKSTARTGDRPVTRGAYFRKG